MTQHHTKDKGDIGVLKAQVDLALQGFTILLPLTEHQAFDLVVYKDGTFKRVQVKYRSATNGKLQIPFRSSWADRVGIHTVHTDKTQIDIYCVYCPETDQCYYFDPNEYKRSVTLRIDMPKNNQSKSIRFANDYRRVP